MSPAPRVQSAGEYLARGLLALAAVAFALVSLEIGFRVATRGRGGEEDGAAAQYVGFDPLLGWSKRAGASALFRRSEYVQEVRINSLGQRDRERVYDRPPGTFRILALGDSFVEGYTVSLEATATQVLEGRLSRPGCPVEVLNAGTAGYSTDQEYLFFREEGYRYEPDVVALFFYYNDIAPTLQGNYYGRPKPQFVARGDTLRLKRGTLPRPSPRERAQLEASDAGGTRSALLEWTRQRLQRGQPGLYNRLAAFGLWSALPVGPPRPDLAVYRRRDIPAWVETGFNQIAALLRALRDEVASRAGRLVVVYVPNPMEVSERARELTRIAYGMNDEDWDVDRVRRRLAAIASRQRIPLVDLTPGMRSAQGLLEGPYLVVDRHWNALGHRIAAVELERGLFEAGLLPPCAEVAGAS